MASTACSASEKAVIISTAVSGDMVLIRPNSSIPPSPGICTSEMTRSKRELPNNSSASSALSADFTVYPSRSSRMVRNSRMLSSSSTIRILIFMYTPLLSNSAQAFGNPDPGGPPGGKKTRDHPNQKTKYNIQIQRGAFDYEY